jgi:predicted PurR-regulated permease PerM
MRTATATVTALVIVAVLAIGGWMLYWFVLRESVNLRAEIRQESYGRQNALVEQILDDIEEAQEPDIPASQRIALVDIICDSAAKLTGSITLPTSAERFLEEECNL